MKIVHFIYFFYVFPSYSTQLPDVLKKHKCRLDDPNFKKCYIESANEAIPEITKGDTELGVPSLYPLKMDFRRLINHPVLQMNLTDISFYGLAEMKMFDVDFNMDKRIIKETFSDQNITVVGDYNIDGKLLLFQVKGNGRFYAYFKNVTFYITHTFKVMKKNGEDYMERESTHADVEIEDAVVNLGNLFRGNKELADIVGKALNNNWRSFLKDYGRFIEEFLEDLFGLFFDKISGFYPIKDIFT